MFFLPAVDETAPADLIVSATDIVKGSSCNYSVLRNLDVLLGRAERLEKTADPLLDLTAELGQKHEEAVLADFITRFGEDRVFIGDPDPGLRRDKLVAAANRTLAALAGDYDVIYQASFFDGAFHGRADFLVREGGRWTVYDTKLARSAKGSALLQLASYAEQLIKAGVPINSEAKLILGTGKITSHPLDELVPEYLTARDQLTKLLAAHRNGTGEAEWGDIWKPCLTKDCHNCRAALEANDDLLLVRGMNRTRRRTLRTAGITTAAAFAALDTIPGDTLMQRLHTQARLQHGGQDADGHRNGVHWKLIDRAALDRIPAPDVGDVFFDFEGDPNWQDPETGAWGIEYLFGLVEQDMDDPGTPTFVPFTAHSIAEERQAFINFMAHIAERRRRYPDMHVYHYAPYEVTALRRLAGRHGILAADVAELVSSRVMVDLLTIAKSALMISDRSFSIKKLEPLYMDEHRTGVSTAADSLAQYAAYTREAAAGRVENARAVMEQILDYNAYDCRSTLHLRNWLLGLRTPVTVGAA